MTAQVALWAHGWLIDVWEQVGLPLLLVLHGAMSICLWLPLKYAGWVLQRFLGQC